LGETLNIMDKYHEDTPPTKLKSAVLGGQKKPLDRVIEIQTQVSEDALKEAWQIINVLNLSHMDEGEPYPKALFWLKEWEHLGYPQPDIK